MFYFSRIFSSRHLPGKLRQQSAETCKALHQESYNSFNHGNPLFLGEVQLQLELVYSSRTTWLIDLGTKRLPCRHVAGQLALINGLVGLNYTNSGNETQKKKLTGRLYYAQNE